MKGFTLIELLVVIAIIGILGSTVLVSLSSARDRSKMAKARTIMQSINSVAYSCVLSGSDLVSPTHSDSGGTPICAGDTAVLPALTGTDFRYCGNPGCGGWWSVAPSGVYGISAEANIGGSHQRIVCASNINLDGWFGLPGWDFTGVTGCKTYGID